MHIILAYKLLPTIPNHLIFAEITSSLIMRIYGLCQDVSCLDFVGFVKIDFLQSLQNQQIQNLNW